MPENVTVGVFDNDKVVRNAVSSLKAADIAEDYISIAAPAGKVKPLENEVQGFHTTSQRIKSGAKWGGWIGGIAGVLGGAAIFFVAPPAGAVIATGAFASLIAGGIEGLVLGAGVGIFATSLASMGIHEPDAKELEQRVAEGEFLVIVKGPAEVVNRADNILRTSDPLHVAAA